MNKKKFLVFLLSLLVTLLLGLYSNCYAYVSNDYIAYCFDTLSDRSITYKSNSSYNNFIFTKLDYIKNTSGLIIDITNHINNQLDTWNLSNLYNTNCYACVEGNLTNFIKVKFIFSNNTVPGNYNLGYVSIKKGGTYITFVTNYDSNPIYILELTINSSNSISYNSTSQTSGNISADASDVTYNNDLTIATIKGFAFAGISIGYISYPWNYNVSSSTMIFQDINGNFQESEPDPEEPSGDISTGGTGTITNSSGDTTGKIDLSGIEHGIGNIQNQISGDSQRIIENQNQNTQTIVNTISGEVSKINNSLVDTSVDVDISGELSSMISSADIDDPTANFFSWLIDELRLVFSETSTQTIEFDFLTQHIVISTDDFIIPDSDLKTFLSLSFTAWFGFSIIKKIHYIVYAVKCVRINDAMKQVEFNPNLL